MNGRLGEIRTRKEAGFGPAAFSSYATSRGGTWGEIRTLTGRGLSALPLPLGYPGKVLRQGIEPSSAGRQPARLARCVREHLSEMRESNPRLRFVGPRWLASVSVRSLRAYETQMRAGARAMVPPGGVEPPTVRFVAERLKSLSGSAASQSGLEPESAM